MEVVNGFEQRFKGIAEMVVLSKMTSHHFQPLAKCFSLRRQVLNLIST